MNLTHLTVLTVLPITQTLRLTASILAFSSKQKEPNCPLHPGCVMTQHVLFQGLLLSWYDKEEVVGDTWVFRLILDSKYIFLTLSVPFCSYQFSAWVWAHHRVKYAETMLRKFLSAQTYYIPFYSFPCKLILCLLFKILWLKFYPSGALQTTYCTTCDCESFHLAHGTPQ